MALFSGWQNIRVSVQFGICTLSLARSSALGSSYCHVVSDWRFWIILSFFILTPVKKKVKVKVNWSRYRPGVAQRLGRGITLLFHDRGTRRGWVVSNTLRPHFTTGKDPVPILQEVGWAPGPVWTGGKSRPHRDLTPYRPAQPVVSRYTDWATRSTSENISIKIYNTIILPILYVWATGISRWGGNIVWGCWRNGYWDDVLAYQGRDNRIVEETAHCVASWTVLFIKYYSGIELRRMRWSGREILMGGKEKCLSVWLRNMR